MKKLISVFLIILTVFTLTFQSAEALFDSGEVTSKLDSKVYYMENLDEGTVFFDKDSNKQVPLAGFAKIIAAIVVLEKWGNLDGEIKITKENLNVFEYIYDMPVALYEEGETVSKKELFDCFVIASANDALSVIAYDVAGTQEKFVQEMQNLVKKMGCTATTVKNMHGFDEEGQLTTARDVAKIVKYAINYPAFSEAFGKDEITLKKTDKNEQRTYYASNQMLNTAVADYYHSSVTGGKHTSTELAGECIATISNADGYSYLTVVMEGEYIDIDEDGYDENTAMTDAQRMLDWVYENIRFKVIANPQQTVATVKVVAGKGNEKIHLIPEKEISALVPEAVTPASVMFEFVDGEAPEKIIAPVKAGDVITQANIYYAGQKLKTINIVAKETVKLSFGGLVVSGIRSVVGSVFFLVLTFLAAAVAVLRFVLDLKDFFDKERKNSYDPLPSSFDVLVGRVKKALSFADRKKKKKAQKKASTKKQNSQESAKKKAPIQSRNPSTKNSQKTVKKTPAGIKKTTSEAQRKASAAKGKGILPAKKPDRR